MHTYEYDRLGPVAERDTEAQAPVTEGCTAPLLDTILGHPATSDAVLCSSCCSKSERLMRPTPSRVAHPARSET